MATNGGGVFVDPHGNTAVVTITSTTGGLFSLFTDANLTVSVLNPATISTPTTFYVAQPGGAATVSVKVNGLELAAKGNNTLPYVFASGAVAGLQAPSDQDGTSIFAPRAGTPTNTTDFWRADSGFFTPAGGGGGASFATPNIKHSTVAAAGVAATTIRSDSTIVTFDTTAPVVQNFGDTAATGAVNLAARRDHVHGMPANPVSFATPTIALGTAAASGAAGTVIRADSTIAAFDVTVPTTSAVGDAASTGVVNFASRRDHAHGRESFVTNTVTLGTAATAGAATTLIRSDAGIAAFDTTVPTTSAVGDAAATGAINFAARRDHLHGREAFATPVATGTANAPGSALTIPRSDHVHRVGGLVFSEDHSDTNTFSNSTAENTLSSLAIPTTLAPGDTIRIVYWLDFQNNTGGGVTYTFRFKIGATTVLTSAAENIPSGSIRRFMIANADIMLVATNNEWVSSTINGYGGAPGVYADSNGLFLYGVASAAEDLTVAKNAILTCQMGTASANADVRCHGSSLQVFRK
jgi:hypothetical protein